MNEVKIFNSPQFGEIRTAGTPDNPTFCLADVCKALHLSASHVKERLSEDVVSTDTLKTAGGMQKMNFVNEDGLYDVILDSRKPEAKVFRKWVTSEVLPSIRKTGGYIAATNDMTDEEIMARALVVAQTTIQRRDERIRQLEHQQAQQTAQIQQQEQQILSLSSEIESMQPKVSYYDKILANKSTVLVTQIALDYGMAAAAFNKILFQLRIQHKVGEQWILYAPYLSQGYVHSKPVEITHKDGRKSIKYNTEWTQKGRLFLYDILKQNNILPLIEQE